MAMKTDKTIKKQPPFTQIVYILGLMAIIVMQYLYWTHRNIFEDSEWVSYTLYMSVFALAGLIGTQLIYDQPIIPFRPEHFAPLSLDTGVRAAIVLAGAMITQLISKAALSFTNQEQAAYFIFAAVCEELFFRVLVLSFFIKISDTIGSKITGVLVQAIIFAAIHQNYYSDLPMLLSVFLGGIILGIFYLVWKDPTANILGHFILNVIAVQNLNVTLSAAGPGSVIMTVGVGLVLISIFFFLKHKKMEVQ